MKLKNRKNIAIIPLLIITTGLWATIIYNIIIRFTSDKLEDNETVNYSMSQNTFHSGKSEINSEDEISYRELDRDPFSMARIRKANEGGNTDTKIIKPVVIPPAKPKLNYSINGVIVNKNSRLVIFEDKSNSKVLFLREGDEYQDIVIESIDVSKIILKENNTTKDITFSK